MRPKLKQALRYVLIGVAAYALFLVTTMPAAVGYAALQRWLPLPKQLQIGELEGSVWAGRAGAVRVGKLDLGAVEWDLNPWALFAARLGADLSLTQADTRLAGYASVGLGAAVHLEDITGTVRASDVQPLLGPLPVVLDGRIGVNLQDVSVDPGESIRATGRLAWTGAALTAPQAVSLGDLSLALEPTDAGSKAVVSDEGGGPLQLQGVAELKDDGAYTLNATLNTRASAQPELGSALRLLGRKQRDGSVEVKLSGKLRGW